MRYASSHLNCLRQHCLGEQIMFTGIQYYPVFDLGVSQIYLNEEKLTNIRSWFNSSNLSSFDPLPVHDFGNGRLTLTDGHSRAFLAYLMGVYKIPIVYDSDDMVTSATGQMLYKNDIIWCERFKIYSISDLKDRIISNFLYNDLWIGRCDKAYNLLMQTTELQRKKWQSMYPDLYLYGASEDLSLLFFEDEQGALFTIPISKS